MKTALLLLLPLFSGQAFAWGCKGHQVVALTAWRFLSDNAKNMTMQLQSSFPPDPALAHYCQGDDSLLPIARVATWADDYRTIDQTTAPWHFLDIPLGQPVGDALGYCEQGCVSKAVSGQYSILSKNPRELSEANAIALRFIIHFLGDMHQPLHLSNNNDQGGNCVPLQYLLTPPVSSSGRYTPELHGVWDNNLVDAAMHALNVQDVTKFSVILAGMASQNHDDWSGGSAADWMTATHAIAERVSYGELTANPAVPDLAGSIKGPDNLKRCSDQGYDKRLAGMGLQVTFSYVGDAVPLVEQQLAKAGLRLANMLNSLWPDPAQ